MWPQRSDNSLPLFRNLLYVIGKVLLHIFCIFPRVKGLFSYFLDLRLFSHMTCSQNYLQLVLCFLKVQGPELGTFQTALLWLRLYCHLIFSLWSTVIPSNFFLQNSCILCFSRICSFCECRHYKPHFPLALITLQNISCWFLSSKVPEIPPSLLSSAGMYFPFYHPEWKHFTVLDLGQTLAFQYYNKSCITTLNMGSQPHKPTIQQFHLVLPESTRGSCGSMQIVLPRALWFLDTVSPQLKVLQALHTRYYNTTGFEGSEEQLLCFPFA